MTYWAWWCILIIPALGECRQEDQEFKTKMGYMRPCLKRQTNKTESQYSLTSTTSLTVAMGISVQNISTLWFLPLGEKTWEWESGLPKEKTGKIDDSICNSFIYYSQTEKQPKGPIIRKMWLQPAENQLPEGVYFLIPGKECDPGHTQISTKQDQIRLWVSRTVK